MGHDHAHAPTSASGRHRWRLALVFALVAAFFAVEVGTGLWSGSLALLSDAGHMSADVVALGAALVATRLATRPDPTGQHTYGSYRAEVFASGITVLIMLGVAVYVVVEAIGRIGRPVEVASTPMLVVGLIGLAVNLASMLLLRAGAQESLNVKGAYFEVVADAAGSVGVIVASLLVAATGDAWWDWAVAVAIGLFVAVRAVVLGRQVVAVLAQKAPAGVDVTAVAATLTALPGVAGVHDLHLWTLTSGMDVATAHLLVADAADTQAVLVAAQQVLREAYHIEHATLQVETAPTAQCEAVTW